MAAKDLQYEAEARAALKRGVDQLANAVKVTLGPKGRNVVIERANGSPVVTKDGVTVANEIELEDPLENMGAQMVKEVAVKTADTAGDGTTTATVLAQAIVREGLKLVTAGANPMALKRGIDKAVTAVVADLKRMSVPVSIRAIAQVGMISANNDQEIGDLIAKAMEAVSKDGVITVEEHQGRETTFETVDGIQFDRGFASPYFITSPEHMEAVLEEPVIIIHDQRIMIAAELYPLLEKVTQMGHAFVLIAADIDGEALAMLAQATIRGSLKCVAIKAPAFGERRQTALQDIAVLTGAVVIAEEVGIKLADAVLADLGKAKRVVVTRDTTTIIDGAGDEAAIERRITEVRNAIEKSGPGYDREKLQERLAKLAGGVAVIKVGAATEAELKEKKARVEDALHATRAAVEEGIVPGGGVALLRAGRAVRALSVDMRGEETMGLAIIARTLEEPIRMIAENAGVEGAIVVETVNQSDDDRFGYNALTDTYEDLIAAGVIDPVKVARSALENAASIAGLLLTTEAVVVNKLKKERS